MRDALLRLLAVLLVLPLLASCGSGKAYYAAEDAPEFIQEGGLDLRLAATRVLGAPMSPLVRNLVVPYGELHGREGVEAFLERELRPLDIVLVRSRLAMTRSFIPGRFTHATVWLGTPAEMKRLGVWNLPAVRARHVELSAGDTVIEAAKNSVHLSPFGEITNVDEIVILRPRAGGPAWAKAKYAALFERLGRRFDYSFDLRDRDRLTCLELVAETFPEFAIPERYMLGRFVLIPDDLARMAVDGSRHIGFAAYLRAGEGTGFENAGPRVLRSVLTAPRPGPA